MVFDIDSTSSVPIYAQLIEQVRRAIAAGVLQPGDALPSLREVSTRMRINPLTVTRAYRELEAAGIVVTEHGRGTFVSALTNTLGPDYRQDALNKAMDRMLVEARHLGATPDEIRTALEDRLRELLSPASGTKTEAVTLPDGGEGLRLDG